MTRGGDMTGPPAPARLAAVGALIGFLASMIAGIALLVRHPLDLTGAVVAWGIAVPAAWAALTGRHHRRAIGTLATVLLLAGLLLLSRDGGLLTVAAVALGLVATVGLGSISTRWEIAALVERRWTRVAAPASPVLFMNPRAGDGKVEKFNLAEEARRRGIETVLLGENDDLLELANAAADRGADVVGMAGGDGSQAVVASVAAERAIGYVCIPAGTRNHLALDLGVDRNDVVGALDAFGAAREAKIDLATVNGRVFVNNVSLGVYAEIVRSDAYRDAKVKTVREKLPDLLGPDAEPFDLSVQPPSGPRIDGLHLVQVSNNPYVLDGFGGFGSRRRLDSGELGVALLYIEAPSDLTTFLALQAAGRRNDFEGWHEWTAPTAQVDSGSPVACAIDGEPMTLPSPLRFAILPNALKVRVARAHPGVSPAATHAALGRSSVLDLIAIAAGRPSGLVDGGR